MEIEFDRRQMAYLMIGFVIGYLVMTTAMMVWDLIVLDFLIGERERVLYYVKESRGLGDSKDEQPKVDAAG